MGFEPTISCVTGRRALRCSTRTNVYEYPEQESNLQTLGSEPSRSASWRSGALFPSEVFPDGIEPTASWLRARRRCRWTTGLGISVDHLIHATTAEPSRVIWFPDRRRARGSPKSCGGRNRTCAVTVNSRPPVPARAPPHQVSQDGWIRTSGLVLPRHAGCQATPHPESRCRSIFASSGRFRANTGAVGLR